METIHIFSFEEQQRQWEGEKLTRVTRCLAFAGPVLLRFFLSVFEKYGQAFQKTESMKLGVVEL